MQLTLRHRRRARTLSLPKPLAPYLTFLPFTPLQRANTPITKIPSRHQAHTHHQCTPHTANPLHPLHRSSPPPPNLSMDLHTHLHHPNLLEHRLFHHRLPLSHPLPKINSTWKVAGLTNPDRSRRRLPHLIRTLSRHTPMDKCAHNPLVLRTLGSASVT